MRPVPDHEGPQALQPVESIVSDNKPQVLVDLLAPSADPTEHYSDIASSQDKPASSPPVRRESRFSRKRPWIWALATVMLLVIVAIVVGCAVPLTHRHKEQRSPTNPVSTVGALNGSGMVMLDEGEGSSQIVAYVQSGDGNIRKLEYLDGRWSGAQKADVVDVLASNPRNGTPVMALAYDRREERIWRVFYVDVDDFLQESIYSNKTQGGWSSGLLGLGRFKASSSKHVGLTACYNPQWYGEPYNSSDGGIRLYYGASNHTVQELLWANGNGAWDNGSNFPDSNGDGGVECTVRNRSVTNVWLLNSNNQLEQRWREFNRSAQTATHPAGTWVSGLNSSEIRPDSAITAIMTGQNVLVHFQLANNTVRELNATVGAENSTWNAYLDVEGRAATPGSRIASVVLVTAQGGKEVHVAYQTNGTDITDFVRTLDGGSWSEEALPLT